MDDEKRLSLSLREEVAPRDQRQLEIGGENRAIRIMRDEARMESVTRG